MIIAFEGIDGSGKTTLARKLVESLRARGIEVAETRPSGAEESAVADKIRDITRDSSSAMLAPVPEFLLFLARYLQQIDEMKERREEILIADRSFYTPVFTAAARQALDVEKALSLTRTCAGDLPWPDLVVLVDVDIETSSIRKRIAKIEEKRLGESRRKGTLGLGARVRLRRVCLETARVNPGRFIVIDNSAPTPEPAFEELVRRVLPRLGFRSADPAGEGSAAAGPDLVASDNAPFCGCPWPGAKSQNTAPPEPARSSRGPYPDLARIPAWFYGEVKGLAVAAPKLAALCLKGLASTEAWALRESLVDRAIEIVAYSLSNLESDRARAMRERLADRAPYHVLHSLPFWSVGEEDIRLRRRLVEASPFEVGLSLKGVDTDWSWEIRKQLESLSLPAALVSLRGLDTPESWRIRDLAGKKESKPLLRGLAGATSEPSWTLRRKLVSKHPIETLQSLAGVGSAEAYALRARFLPRAPETVMRSIEGLFDDQAMDLRRRAVTNSREAIGGLWGCESDAAWDLREAYLDLWPAAAVASLGTAWSSLRGRRLIKKAMAAAPGSLKLGRCITRYMEAE